MTSLPFGPSTDTVVEATLTFTAGWDFNYFFSDSRHISLSQCRITILPLADSADDFAADVFFFRLAVCHDSFWR
jgi:hypothetical protein